MGLSKDDTAVAVGVGLLLLGGGVALASTKKTAKPSADPNTDGANLLKRANQSLASAWAKDFADASVSPLTAQALARWAGIESSGKQGASSRLDERGLMQAGPQSVSEGLLTQAEWDALKAPGTPRKRHVEIAIKYVDGLARKAETYSAIGADPVNRVWFAKLWHQWPVDVRDVVGPMSKQGLAAPELARQLATVWAADPVRMHRLRAANVVAFGTPNP